jgi:O-methyltransferase
MTASRGEPKRASAGALAERVRLLTERPVTQRIRRGAKRAVRRGLSALGYDVRRKRELHADFEPHLLELCDTVAPYTLTSRERIAALANATEYVVRKGIRGDFVECGVWRGGSMMAIALILQRLGAADRRLWLYDTFTTVPPPGPKDADVWGRSREQWARNARPGGAAADHSELKRVEDVRSLLLTTGYAPALLTFVEGMVEKTIPANAPEQIALLRLDTDWYESTRHELEHLYPKLEPGGVLIVDDYGEFLGARQAVDEYFAEDPVLLNRIDFTGRVAVKLR